MATFQSSRGEGRLPIHNRLRCPAQGDCGVTLQATPYLADSIVLDKSDHPSTTAPATPSLDGCILDHGPTLSMDAGIGDTEVYSGGTRIQSRCSRSAEFSGTAGPGADSGFSLAWSGSDCALRWYCNDSWWPRTEETAPSKANN